MSVHPVESRHPILAAAADIGAAPTRAVGANPVFMTTAEMDEALRELSALEARVVELRLRVMAVASEVAKSTAAHDVAEWLSVHTLMRPEDARADLRLATALDRRYAALAAAMREGGVSVDQARVIARALDELPARTFPPTSWWPPKPPWSSMPPGSDPASWPGSAAASSRWWRLGSSRRPRPVGWPPSRPTPTAAPGSPCAGSETAPPASPGSSPTRSPPGWRPTWRPSPTLARHGSGPQETATHG
ncbi:DUF222 domain-containing protein [Nocardioides sp.]|uniref:DUF222 domain-containing protein n=1 Tax=Nocardioides sp. TaxID=35761 RepID=UPI0035286EEB